MEKSWGGPGPSYPLPSATDCVYNNIYNSKYIVH